MKAPDKIYLTEWDGKGVSEYETPWSPAPYGNRNCKNHEYIRKDALLEWAENELVTNSSYEQFLIGRLIDKLNSL